MKMSYLRKNNNKFRKVLIWALIIIFMLFILSFTGAGKLFGGVMHYVGYPFWKAKSFVFERSYFITGVWQSRLNMAEENLMLKEELLIANLKLKGKELLEAEIRDLNALLNREDLSRVKPVMVLSNPPQTAYDFLIVQGGKDIGLKGGEKIFFESVILGEVEEVFQKTARIKTFSSGGVKTEGFVERSGLPVTLYGKGGGNFESRLPQEVDIEEGDFVIIPGIANRFIGQVESIESNPTDSFKTVFLRYPLNLSTVRWVAVETK